MISISEAKAMSLKNWQAIRDALPYGVTMSYGQPSEDVYGKCGFCLRGRCPKCPLYPEVCSYSISDSLYWQIVAALENNKQDEAAPLIDKMIEAIEKVKDDN